MTIHDLCEPPPLPPIKMKTKTATFSGSLKLPEIVLGYLASRAGSPLIVVDLRGSPPSDPNSFNFMQFWEKFGKILCWRPLAGWRPHLREILEPPLGQAISPKCTSRGIKFAFGTKIISHGQYLTNSNMVTSILAWFKGNLLDYFSIG